MGRIRFTEIYFGLTGWKKPVKTEAQKNPGFKLKSKLNVNLAFSLCYAYEYKTALSFAPCSWKLKSVCGPTKGKGKRCWLLFREYERSARIQGVRRSFCSLKVDAAGCFAILLPMVQEHRRWQSDPDLVPHWRTKQVSQNRWHWSKHATSGHSQGIFFWMAVFRCVRIVAKSACSLRCARPFVLLSACIPRLPLDEFPWN